jgi:hypothetical protein
MFIDPISVQNPVGSVIPSKSALLPLVSHCMDNLDNFKLASWMPDADAQGFEPNGAPSLPRFAADYLHSLRFPHSAGALAHLRSLAHQEGFELSACDSLHSRCIRLYCHRGETGKGDQKSTKTGCAFRLNL